MATCAITCTCKATYSHIYMTYIVQAKGTPSTQHLEGDDDGGKRTSTTGGNQVSPDGSLKVSATLLQ